MIVTIWRHGEAGQASRDYERTLTDRGCDDVGFGVQQFHTHCESRGLPHPDRIRCSPWTRTQQTADIISAAFTHAECKDDQRIQPGVGPDDAMQLLEEAMALDSVQHVLLVSHQPLVSLLVESLLGERGPVPPLSPGALAVLDLEVAVPGGATLLFWSAPPEYGAGV